MIDIEDNERRAVLALMRDNALPTPDDATRAALTAAGVEVGPSGPGEPLVVATLPAGWRKEPAAEHRAFYLVDDRGVRRFYVAWKAPLLFSSEPGRGWITEADKRDAFARTWSADDSYEVQAMGHRYFTILCPACGVQVRWSTSTFAERDRPGLRADCEARAEHAFARDHGPGCRALATGDHRP